MLDFPVWKILGQCLSKNTEICLKESVAQNYKERESEGCVEEPEPSVDLVIDDIVTVAESTGLQVVSGDVEEPVEEHSEELSSEELQQLLAEQQ
ncbi:hypothetical protein H920_11557 [Fukomys damarensis]|uniref:Uncharacterized protein n=1 Tax=Fukomys damarensis TaxID=885580 RepID=A0A091D9V6_FUKDA|nr:hypothetical protein H920_11557 [Fukomys damarensis]